MAAPLPPGPPPDEQDFVQAYEEVRERYKGTRAGGPASRSAWPRTPCPRRLRTAAGQSPVPRAPARPRAPRPAPGRRLRAAPAVMPLIGHRAAREVGWPRGGGSSRPVSASRAHGQQARGSARCCAGPSPEPPTWGRGGCHRLAVGRIAVASPHLPNGQRPGRLPPLAGTLVTPLCPPWPLWAGEVRAAPFFSGEEPRYGFGLHDPGPLWTREIQTAVSCLQPGPGPCQAPRLRGLGMAPGEGEEGALGMADQSGLQLHAAGPAGSAPRARAAQGELLWGFAWSLWNCSAPTHTAQAGGASGPRAHLCCGEGGGGGGGGGPSPTAFVGS